MKTSKHLFLNSFVLKILAMVFMAIDHVGAIAIQSGLFQTGSTFYNVCVVFRYIGRLAFPLFMFFLAEGMRHTKARDRYIMRLAILWVGITLVQFIVVQAGLFSSSSMSPNAFTDLIMCALFIYLLEKKQVWLRILAILPLAYIVVGYACDVSEQYCYVNGMTSNWSTFFPYYLRADYSIYGLLLFLGFYYSRPLAQKVTSMYLQVSAPLPPITANGEEIKEQPKEEELFDITKTNEYQTLLNTINIAVIVVVNLIFYVIYRIGANSQYDIYVMTLQTWSIFSAVFLVFYNGKLGYHAKWWKYFEYLFYPVHLLLIYLIFFLVGL